jgi:hypothetical protein
MYTSTYVPSKKEKELDYNNQQLVVVDCKASNKNIGLELDKSSIYLNEVE